MPVTIKTANMKYKNNQGEYVGINAVAETKTAEQIATIQSAGTTQINNIQSAGTTQINNIQVKGQQTLVSIPSDYTSLSKNVNNTINTLINANSYDFIQFLEHSNTTNNGVTFTWNENKTECTVVGTASPNASFSYIYDTLSSLPYGMEKGKEYFIEYSSDNVQFQVLEYKNNAFIKVLLSTKTDTVFIIPSDVEQIAIRLTVLQNTTANEIVSPRIYSTKSNKELNKQLSKNVNNTINTFINANSYNFIQFLEHPNRTHSGVTFTWNENNTECTVVGSTNSTDAAFDVIYNISSSLPYGMEKGKEYRVKYSSDNVQFQVLEYKNNVFVKFLLFTTTDTVFTIPSDVEQIAIRLTVLQNTTANEIVSPKIYTTETNKELSENVNSKIIGTYTFTSFDIESGSWSYSNKTDNPKRLRTKTKIWVDKGTVIQYQSPTLDISFWIMKTLDANSFIQNTGWKSAGVVDKFKVEDDGYLIFLLQSNNDITINDYDSIITIYPHCDDIPNALISTYPTSISKPTISFNQNLKDSAGIAKPAIFSNNNAICVTYGENLVGTSDDYPRVNGTGTLAMKYKSFIFNNGQAESLVYGHIAGKGDSYIKWDETIGTFEGGCGLPSGAYGYQFFCGAYINTGRTYNGFENYGMMPCCVPVSISTSGTVTIGTIHEMSLTINNVKGAFDVYRINPDNVNIYLYYTTASPYFDGSIWHWLIPVRGGFAYCVTQNSEPIDWTYLRTIKTPFQPICETSCTLIKDTNSSSNRVLFAVRDQYDGVYVGILNASNTYINKVYLIPAVSARANLIKAGNGALLLFNETDKYECPCIKVDIKQFTSHSERLTFTEWFRIIRKCTWYSTIEQETVKTGTFSRILLAGGDHDTTKNEGISIAILNVSNGGVPNIGSLTNMQIE